MRPATHHAADRLSLQGGLRIGATGLVVAFVTGLLVPSAFGETIPLPRPAPKARGASFQVSASEPPAATAALAVTAAPAVPAAPTPRAPMTIAAATTNSAPPNPIIPDPRRNVPANFFASFDATQKAQAGKVSAYLSSLNTLVGNFVQVGPDGSRTKGDFYIQKPGKVRFEYDAPTTIAMVADGSSLAVRDTKLATQDIYPLSQTPLRYLLSDRIDLLRDTNVVAITGDDLYTSVTIEEKNALVGTSRLMLMIGTKDGQLKQWTVTDPQGYDTTVAIYNLDTTKKPDAGLFKIDFTKYPTSGAN
ncbi:outer membrane lipoprotein carrier protein LolA [Tardiphaga sp.]|uniref:outer membrane lipoprotein carrier protein LolA n=1 Tax=Tardiphaga sp. TaxID=1926292 RepID=UPI002634DC15|nr:outer membrane lipoprotein carrier protein LolA [Tardiphaga sp.]